MVVVARRFSPTGCQPIGRLTMKDRKDDLPKTDEFEPIELGSVSEETRGGQERGIEFAVGPNSRLDG